MNTGTEWRPSQMNVPWTESPFFEQELAASDLSEEQREMARSFARDGFLVFDPEIGEATIDAANSQLAGSFVKGEYYDTRVPDSEAPAVLEIATWPKVLELLEILYRRDPIPFQTLNFHVGTQQPIHNDAIHFHAIPHRFMCGVWIALEDIDDENGPLFYYPGSHRLPIYEMPDLGLAAHTDSYPPYVAALDALMGAHGLEAETLHISKGQGMVWAANLHHGGSAVVDESRTRQSQVTHYYFSDCVYYSPQGTDLVAGTLQLRDVRDLRSGEMVPHVYRGRVLHTPTEPGATTLRMTPANAAQMPPQPPAPAQAPDPAADGSEPGAAKAFWYRARGKVRSMLRD